jgi:hypothetical protein
MRQNIGILDRCLRTCVVAPGLFFSSWFVFVFGSVIGILFLVVTGIMLASSAVGFCPTYTLFGISTVESKGTFGLFEQSEAIRSEIEQWTGSTRTGRAA